MNDNQQINPEIFRAYDIRGIYPTDLNETFIAQITQAFYKLIAKENPNKALSIVVASDMRLSSPSLKKMVIDTLLRLDVHVLDIGLASTPTFYFSVGYLKADAGFQVSASHNPSEWNGCKLVRAFAFPVSGDNGIYEIRDTIKSLSPLPTQSTGKLTLVTDMLTKIVPTQTSDFNLTSIKPYKIVLDPANAMGILDFDALFSHLPCTLVKLNYELDGSFPNHEADPLKSENLVQISKAVINHHADFGIASDGDSDRIFIVDDLGKLIQPEILRGILAQRVLKKHPHSSIGYDIRPGQITNDLIVEAGGVPFVTRVGHSLIKEEMIKQNSPFSGESSGHFFYKTAEGSFEAPIRMITEFLLWLSEFDQPLSSVLKPYRKYFHSGEINSTVVDKAKVFSKLKEKYKDAPEKSEIDGVFFKFKDYWFNVRGSNTEPKMRLNLEATTKSLMETKRDEVLKIIQS